MAQHFPCAIYIVGVVPRSLLVALADSINRSGGGPDWGSPPYDLEPEDIEAAAGTTFPVLDDQAEFGAMRELEMLLLQNNVDFDRLSDANDGYSAYLLRGRTVEGNTQALRRSPQRTVSRP